MKKQIAIIDYGAGNIFSVKNALDFLGVPNILTNSKTDIENADALILPGVGAFPWAMGELGKSGLTGIIKTQAQLKPFLGICLGMQLLFSKGYEFEEKDGLDVIKGSVEKIPDSGFVIPHMGWNKLEKQHDCPLSRDLSDDEYVYFVHSYQACCSSENIAYYAEYGSKIPAMVFNGNVFGCQFHPEKSGETGLKILKNFTAL